MILITGGGGFIGLNLAKYLVDKWQNVLLVRRHSFAVPSFLAPYTGKQVTIARGDISEPSVLYSLIKNYSVDSIIHAAVLQETSIDATLHQAVKVNLQGTADVLEAARLFNLKRATFLSSISVYMPYQGQDKALTEDNPLPVAAAGWITGTKRAGQQICLLYAKDYGMSVPIVRPPQVWGPLYWSGWNPVQKMVESAIAGKPCDLTNVYGGSKSEYIYVRDCARAIGIVHLSPVLKHDIYNFSDGESHSFADFAEAIKEVIPGAQISLGEKPPATGTSVPSMSIERIKSELGFKPDYDFKQAVRAYIEWVRDGKYV